MAPFGSQLFQYINGHIHKSQQVRSQTQLKTYWRFTTNMLDIALHHHYQHINCVYVFGSKHL